MWVFLIETSCSQNSFQIGEYEELVFIEVFYLLPRRPSKRYSSIKIAPFIRAPCSNPNLVILVIVVTFITRYIYDIKNAKEDRVRGRNTALIVLGDEMVRC